MVARVTEGDKVEDLAIRNRGEVFWHASVSQRDARSHTRLVIVCTIVLDGGKKGGCVGVGEGGQPRSYISSERKCQI
jgi:hypothetical protein